MGITAANRATGRLPACALLAACLSSCSSAGTPARRPAEVLSPESREIEIRIGLLVGATSASVGASRPVIVSQPDGSRVVTIPAGEAWHVTATGSGLTISGPSGWVSAPLEAITLLATDPTAPLRVNGKPYRGQADVLRDRTGLTVVNRLGLESYLLGVVSAEMGRRSSTEQAALRAQAVISRTYALRHLRRWRSQGFDLYATVSDQAYGGVNAETLEGRAAVRETRGRVLTYNGALIEAFYFSTCGGRTAGGLEVFRGASRPYLRSISDLASNGVAYCRTSPRYHWREEWTGESLRGTLQRYLPQLAGTRSESIDRVSDIRITRRSSSGRVDQVAVRLGRSEILVDGQSRIRQALRTSTGDLLRSTAFSLVATGAGKSVTNLVADGMGAGHGVGLCQWGAVGRARAGQGYEQILAAYYPGTRLERRY